MHEKNLYQELDLEEYLWGDIFLVDIDEVDINDKDSRLDLLDEQCKRKGLTMLRERWEEIDLATAKELLRKMLEYDLAYPSARIMSTDKAEHIFQTLLYPFIGKSLYCYTNWKGSPWVSNAGAGWNPLTKHTFDFGIVFIEQKALLFAYSISED